MKFIGGIKMLEQLVSGTSKTVIFAGKELTKGIATAQKELNPEFIKQQAGAKAKFELMKKQYIKQNGNKTASIDMQATKMFQQWKKEQDEQQAMADEMFAEFQEPEEVVKPVAEKTFTAAEVQAMLAQIQNQKEVEAV